MEARARCTLRWQTPRRPPCARASTHARPLAQAAAELSLFSFAACGSLPAAGRLRALELRDAHARCRLALGALADDCKRLAAEMKMMRFKWGKKTDHMETG